MKIEHFKYIMEVHFLHLGRADLTPNSGLSLCVSSEW